MKKQLLRHIEILKTVPEIKESIEELEKWCILLDSDNIYKNFTIIEKTFNGKYIIWEDDEWKYEVKEQYEIEGYYNIIWQLQERHLRIFLDDKNFFLHIINWWFNCLCLYWRREKFTYLKYDNSKPYNEQSEEFFKKLNYWIIKEFSINI